MSNTYEGFSNLNTWTAAFIINNDPIALRNARLEVKRILRRKTSFGDKLTDHDRLLMAAARIHSLVVANQLLFSQPSQKHERELMNEIVDANHYLPMEMKTNWVEVAEDLIAGIQDEEGTQSES